jgi:hypothetical protein
MLKGEMSLLALSNQSELKSPFIHSFIHSFIHPFIHVLSDSGKLRGHEELQNLITKSTRGLFLKGARPGRKFAPNTSFLP